MNSWYGLVLVCQLLACCLAEGPSRDFRSVLQSQFMSIHDAVEIEKSLSGGKYDDHTIKLFEVSETRLLYTFCNTTGKNE